LNEKEFAEELVPAESNTANQKKKPHAKAKLKRPFHHIYNLLTSLY